LEAQIASLGLAGRVRLHGSVPDPTSLWCAFDVVVQPSRSEGLPNAMLEAASAGRPIVATAAGGTGEIVLDGDTGLLVPVDDAAAMGAALRRLLADAGLRDRLGAAARDRTLTVFGMERFVAEFGAMYEELARARRPSR
jgi:glycosyltransferase involved in cell wall biosynthesis